MVSGITIGEHTSSNAANELGWNSEEEIMRTVSSSRDPLASAVVGVALLGFGCVVSGASARTAGAATTPQSTVAATRIARANGTLAPGSPVHPADIAGQRVFVDAKHGFALASVASADYPVATADGGKTWRTDGPALHLDAAQAPLAVVALGAVNRQTLFAWGGGQVIDTTSDGGTAWYSALFTVGSPVAVVQGPGRQLLAFVAAAGGGTVREYVSANGGRTWHYQTTAGRTR